MEALQVQEDMPIESGMLTRSLDGAQKKAETHYCDIRYPRDGVSHTSEKLDQVSQYIHPCLALPYHHFQTDDAHPKTP